MEPWRPSDFLSVWILTGFNIAHLLSQLVLATSLSVEASNLIDFPDLQELVLCLLNLEVRVVYTSALSLIDVTRPLLGSATALVYWCHLA